MRQFLTNCKQYFTAKIRELRGMLFMAYLMAVASFYAAKALRYTLRLAMYLPDNYLQLIADDTCKTTDGKDIIVQHAANSAGDITNKLKLFMQLYWKNATDTLERRSGFRLQDYVHVFTNEGLAIWYKILDAEANTTASHHTRCIVKKNNEGPDRLPDTIAHNHEPLSGEQWTDDRVRETTFITLDGHDIILNEWDDAHETQLRELCNVVQNAMPEEMNNTTN